MDPFTAISLAGNILKFVLYAKDILREGEDIPGSPTESTTKDQEFLSLSSRLTDAVNSITLYTNTTGDEASSTEKKIGDLGSRCIELADHIQNEVNTNAAKSPSLLNTAKSALWGDRGNIADPEKQKKELEEIRNTLLKHLITHIR